VPADTVQDGRLAEVAERQVATVQREVIHLNGVDEPHAAYRCDPTLTNVGVLVNLTFDDRHLAR
jgi:hypothetical protein